jgi:tRNA threonylcarbamoyl adenosine modification protein (Sua5/YciO/YrdC/YwlC family)
LQHPKRKTIGIRIPDSTIAQALVKELAEPLFSSTLILPGEKDAMSDPYEIRERLEKEVDLIIDGDVVPYEPTTIIGFMEDKPEIIRQGKAFPPSLK